jgi:LysR family transcriptional activator of nhaA
MPGDKSAQKSRLLAWFDRHKLQPQVSGEFDDTALMKMFGQQGYGVFSAPTATEAFVLEQFDVGVIARLDEVKEQFYAITPKRNMHHPAIDLLISEASKILDHSSAA